MFAVFGRAEAEAEEKVQVQLQLRQQVEINNRLRDILAGLQIKLADQKANKESVQQHRHETNRCLDALTEAQGEKRQMQKRMDELEAAVETANSRWVSL